MGKRQLSEEQKRKMQEGRQRAAQSTSDAEGTEKAKRASLDEQIEAATAAANAGDTFAAEVLGLVQNFQAQLEEAQKLPKVLKKKMRKLLSTLKD
jgi:hypothetical protein